MNNTFCINFITCLNQKMCTSDLHLGETNLGQQRAVVPQAVAARRVHSRLKPQQLPEKKVEGANLVGSMSMLSILPALEVQA